MTSEQYRAYLDPEVCSVPELTIERSHLPKQDQVDRLLDIRQKTI